MLVSSLLFHALADNGAVDVDEGLIDAMTADNPTI